MPKLSIEKKLTNRTKTRQHMVLSDTSGTAFDKISMDIVRSLPITEGGYSYTRRILTIQDLLMKYLMAVLLE